MLWLVVHVSHGQDRSGVLRPRLFQTENIWESCAKGSIWSALAITNVHNHFVLQQVALLGYEGRWMKFFFNLLHRKLKFW